MANSAHTEEEGDAEEIEQREKDLVIIERALTILMEHFEAVQIHVTRPTKGESNAGCSTGMCRGRGNWYARKGMVDDWLRDQNAR